MLVSTIESCATTILIPKLCYEQANQLFIVYMKKSGNQMEVDHYNIL